MSETRRARRGEIASGYRQCAVDQRTTQFCALLEAAVAAEREACAKVCERIAGRSGGDMRAVVLNEAADVIRARGEQ